MNWIKFLVIFLWPMATSIGSNNNPRLFVRNVGQGLWITAIERRHCLHFDAGGELYSPLGMQACQSKENKHYLSHLDWDHISFLYRLKKLERLCRVGIPLEKKRHRPLRHYKEITPCKNSHKDVRELKFKASNRHPNTLSRVFIYKNWVLLPGDSPKSMEKQWSKQLPDSVRILVLGHHGSHTSTSDELLSALPKLTLAIVSARKKKYGHPHKRVTNRLRKFGVPVLRTENWGNIILEVPTPR